MKKITIEGNSAIISVKPKIHNLDVVYSAAYTFLDRAYILLDGDPDKEIIVTMKPKGKEDPEKLGLEFNNELLNYSHYKSKVKDLGEIRQAILQRSLLIFEKKDEEKKEEIDDFELDEKDMDFLDDPEGIAIPWEEKYGKKSKGKKSSRKAK
jgi:His-Xaa-Ser system protein HxsD